MMSRCGAMETRCIWVFGMLACFDIVVSRLTCPTPKVANGFGRIIAGKQSQSKIIYFCRRNFKLYGRKSAQCYNGRWTNPFPHCIATGCSVPDTFENGRRTAYRDDAVLLFECDEGFELRGNENAFCDGKDWDQIPHCISFKDINSCGFERHSLCGWTQDARDQFDWRWHSRTTSTDHTGPQHDHTLGPASKDGHYLYIESSAPRVSGDTARLVSPVYPPLKSGQCFSWWYHMLGPDEENEVGVLQIKLRYPHSDSTEVLLFEIEGNQGVDWKQGVVYIDRLTSSFQLVISATRKQSYVGDIAVDDIKFFACEDYPIKTITSLSTSLETTPIFKTTERTESTTTEATIELQQTSDSSSEITTSSIILTSSTTKTSAPSTMETVPTTTDKQLLTTYYSIYSTDPQTTETVQTQHDKTTSKLSTAIYENESRENVKIEAKLKNGHNQTKESELVSAMSKKVGISKETTAVLLSVGVGCLLVIVIVLGVIVYVRYKIKQKQRTEAFDDLHNANAIYRKTSTDILI